MDATRITHLAVVLLCSLVTGCAQQAASEPAAQPPPAETVEPPQVVLGSASEQTPTEEPGAGPVDAYLRRIEQALAGRKPRPQTKQAVDVELMPQEMPAYTPPPPQPRPVPVAEAPPPESEPAPVSAPPAAPKSPVLANVQVRAASPTRTPRDDQGAVQPNTTIDTASMPPALRDFLERRPKVDDASYAQQLDERILWALAGDYDQAREPLELVTADQQTIATRFVEALIALREAQDGDLGVSAAAATSQLAALQKALRNVSDLSVTDVRLCSAVRGFGQYEAIDPPQFVAGGVTEFVLYVEVSDFASEKRADGLFHTVIDLKTQIVNKAGEQVYEISDPDITDRCRNQRRDFFVPRLVRLPASLAPGAYVAKVTVTDKLGQKVAQARSTFELVARP